MRRYWLVLTLGGAAIAGCCYRAPWVQGGGAFQSEASLGFAPIWTADFRYFPGARVDVSALVTHLILAVGLAALIGLGQALRRPEAAGAPSSGEREPRVIAGPHERHSDDVLPKKV